MAYSIGTHVRLAQRLKASGMTALGERQTIISGLQANRPEALAKYFRAIAN